LQLLVFKSPVPLTNPQNESCVTENDNLCYYYRTVVPNAQRCLENRHSEMNGNAINL